MKQNPSSIIDRIADGVDLAIDFLTLGQYGLESAEPTAKASARAAGCEGGSRFGVCREALVPARSRGCEGIGRQAAAPHAAA